jgi:hypothetical protein
MDIIQGGNTMENNESNIIMSRLAFERMQAKDERNDLWRNITIITLIILLVVTNAVWLIAWNQYDYVDDYTEVSADGDSNANYIGNDGDISNGSENSSQETEQDS